ncbi:hypothetical protein [Marisediminitalea sp.]|jgi:hypothetical protein|uniref:hypothetical protein n=1 Tax=Marisediminitalea sp. TaxID=2662268 RepID=UPI0035125A79
MNVKLVRTIQFLALLTAIASVWHSEFNSIKGAVLLSLPFCTFFATIKPTDTRDIINIAAFVFLALAALSAVMLFAIEPDAQAAIGVFLLLALQYLISIVFLIAYWRGNGRLGNNSV